LGSGTLPLALIFLVSWTTGSIIAMLPGGKRPRRGDSRRIHAQGSL
jgi:uncharacterized integral membrane protein